MPRTINFDQTDEFDLVSQLNAELNAPSEEKCVEILTQAIRAECPKAKAQLFVDLGNMALALADDALGSQVVVAESVCLKVH